MPENATGCKDQAVTREELEELLNAANATIVAVKRNSEVLNQQGKRTELVMSELDTLKQAVKNNHPSLSVEAKNLDKADTVGAAAQRQTWSVILLANLSWDQSIRIRGDDQSHSLPGQEMHTDRSAEPDTSDVQNRPGLWSTMLVYAWTHRNAYVR